MWKSLKFFLNQFIKIAWTAIIFVFLNLTGIYNLIKPVKWRDITLLNIWGYIGCTIAIIIIILYASIIAYHKLRMQKMAEYLKYAPELNKDRIFRIFYKLYKEGEFLKNANAERRQKWDEEVLINMEKYCTFACKMNYLIDTGRRADKVSLLQDEYYDKAVSRIQDYLDNMFQHYTKL